MEPGSIQMTLIAEYNAVMGEEPSTIDQYLKGISRSSILQAGAFLLGFKAKNSIYQDYRSLIEMFFREGNLEFAQQMINRLDNLKFRTGSEVVVINPITSLTLFQYAFDFLGETDTQDELQKEQNIFLAYLALNQINTSSQKKATESTTDIPFELRLSAMAFAQSYAYSDILNYDELQLFVCQIIKAAFLFEYLGEDPRTNVLLKEFLAYYKCDNYKDYLKMLTPIVAASVAKKNEAHVDIVVPEDDQFDEHCDFIEKLSVVENQSLERPDFVQLRAHPLYKVQKGTYRLIYGLFVIEKLFKGLYFKLSQINDTLPKNQRVKDLHGLYSDEFSEKILLYRILGDIYSNKYICKSGQDFKAAGVTSEPDYYIRNGNTIFLFESKDFMIATKTKTSYDYLLLEDIFKKKLFSDNGPKAVLQLIQNVRRILKRELKIDDKYNCKSIYIYPILVLHDHQYDAMGLNRIVNSWFTSEVSKLKEESLNTDRIQDLVIINIDILIFYLDLFKDRTIKLDELIDDFHRFITFDKKKKYKDKKHHDEHAMRQLIPFSQFVTSQIEKSVNTRMPKLLQEKGLEVYG